MCFAFYCFCWFVWFCDIDLLVVGASLLDAGFVSEYFVIYLFWWGLCLLVVFGLVAFGECCGYYRCFGVRCDVYAVIFCILRNFGSC